MFEIEKSDKITDIPTKIVFSSNFGDNDPIVVPFEEGIDKLANNSADIQHKTLRMVLWVGSGPPLWKMGTWFTVKYHEHGFDLVNSSLKPLFSVTTDETLILFKSIARKNPAPFQVLQCKFLRESLGDTSAYSLRCKYNNKEFDAIGVVTGDEATTAIDLPSTTLHMDGSVSYNAYGL